MTNHHNQLAGVIRNYISERGYQIMRQDHELIGMHTTSGKYLHVFFCSPGALPSKDKHSVSSIKRAGGLVFVVNTFDDFLEQFTGQKKPQQGSLL